MANKTAAKLVAVKPAAVKPAPIRLESSPLFTFTEDDPFAVGVLRMFAPGAELPFIMTNENCKRPADALNNYILRAAGGCDIARAEKAKKALQKIKGAK